MPWSFNLAGNPSRNFGDNGQYIGSSPSPPSFELGTYIRIDKCEWHLPIRHRSWDPSAMKIRGRHSILHFSHNCVKSFFSDLWWSPGQLMFQFHKLDGKNVIGQFVDMFFPFHCQRFPPLENEIRKNYLWEKVMEFLFFNEILEKLNYFKEYVIGQLFSLSTTLSHL